MGMCCDDVLDAEGRLYMVWRHIGHNFMLGDVVKSLKPEQSNTLEQSGFNVRFGHRRPVVRYIQ
jgi:hypothetical protein